MNVASGTDVVEQMLDHVVHGRWDALADSVTDDFVIIEPSSLPYGGEHRGVAGYSHLMNRIGSLFDLAFESPSLLAIDHETVLLRMRVTFKSKRTARRITLPVLEVLSLRAGRVARSEVFLWDTAALLETLD